MREPQRAGSGGFRVVAAYIEWWICCVGLRPDGRSTDGASIAKAWLAPSVGCRVQRGRAPREPLVDARDADMAMVRDTLRLWASAAMALVPWCTVVQCTADTGEREERGTTAVGITTHLFSSFLYYINFHVFCQG